MEDEDGDKDRMQQVWKLHTCRRSVLPPPGAVLPATPPHPPSPVLRTSSGQVRVWCCPGQGHERKGVVHTLSGSERRCL